MNRETPTQECIATCRAGLEPVVARELENIGVTEIRPVNRAVSFRATREEIYRCNMALRSALNVLLPIRTFNARNYDILYFQARRTNWHKFFPVGKNQQGAISKRAVHIHQNPCDVHSPLLIGHRHRHQNISVRQRSWRCMIPSIFPFLLLMISDVILFSSMR